MLHVQFFSTTVYRKMHWIY